MITFTETALRIVLEVVDRRRPIGHLAGYLAESATASVVGHCRSRPASTTILAPARLARVRVQWSADGAAEVFGTYTRGGRHHAFAGRVEPAENLDRRRSAPARTNAAPARTNAAPAGTGTAAAEYASTPLCTPLPARGLRPRPHWRVAALHLG